MKKILLVLLIITTLTNAEKSIDVTGELKALKTDNYAPPSVRNIWQYTISYMADDGSVLKPGMPALMFKTDAIQTKLIESKGKLGIKQSELKNKQVNKTEFFEKKLLEIEEKKMLLDKAARKAKLPKSVLAKNDYLENQLNQKLAVKQYQSAKLDLQLNRQKSITEEKILRAEITKLQAEIKEYTSAISSMNMFSKSSGIVMHKSNWSGNKFAIGDTVWNGQRVMEVANLSQIIAKLEIPENNIKHIKQGQSVIVKLDALPDKEFKGKIESIARVVKIKSKNQPSKILEATIFMDDVDTEVMRPGMRLNATILTGDKS